MLRLDVSNIKRSYGGIILGTFVRKQLNHQFIFRVRRGGAYVGSIEGHLYQQKYGYVVPLSINNVESEPYRTHWRASVDYWKNILTDEQRQAYNNKAVKGLRMSGYNLFMRAAMKGEISMYVYRGDPATGDFALVDMTVDGAWHELDLSAIVPSNARAVNLIISGVNAAAYQTFTIKKNGQTNNFNVGGVITPAAGVAGFGNSVISIGSDRKLEYNFNNTTWTGFMLTVMGWWT
ncbi:hypothetical protein LCGC14_1243990 [marine sediment metagenome]|uniref:Uncharacterized protein n=1 Tax=marine sediment metagenome TaxID=412755 RepID=A0A0F9L513_9ZZZZ